MKWMVKTENVPFSQFHCTVLLHRPLSVQPFLYFISETRSTYAVNKWVQLCVLWMTFYVWELLLQFTVVSIATPLTREALKLQGKGCDREVGFFFFFWLWVGELSGILWLACPLDCFIYCYTESVPAKSHADYSHTPTQFENLWINIASVVFFFLSFLVFFFLLFNLFRPISLSTY